MTLKSMYSFVQEIAQDNSSFYEPRVIEWMKPDRRFAGDNPDAQYFTLFIDPNADYMVSGEMNDLVFLEVTSYRKENGVNRVSNSIILRERPKYSLKLSLSKESRPDLLLNKDDYIVMVRYYRKDPKITKIKPKIETTCETVGEIGNNIELGAINSY